MRQQEKSLPFLGTMQRASASGALVSQRGLFIQHQLNKKTLLRVHFSPASPSYQGERDSGDMGWEAERDPRPFLGARPEIGGRAFTGIKVLN